MPLRIRWAQKEYLCIAVMLLGLCGLFQAFYIFISQYFFKIGNYIVIIIIPIGVTFALFYATTIVFDSFAQEHHRKKIKSQYRKKLLQNKRFQNFLEFPIVKPLLIVFTIFSVVFFPAYFISQVWFNNIISFIVAENIGTIFCIFSVNLIEKRYGKVQRF